MRAVGNEFTRASVDGPVERQRLDKISTIEEVFNNFFRNQEANLASDLELPLISALELSAAVQEQWREFMATKIMLDVSEARLKSKFACLLSILCSFLDGLLRLLQKIQSCTPGQQTILCSMIEYCLADLYVNFPQRFEPLIKALASLDLPLSAVAVVQVGSRMEDIMDVVLGKVAAFIVFFAEFDKLPGQNAYILSLINQISNISNMLLATLWLVKTQVNRENPTLSSQTQKIAKRIQCLNFSGHVVMRGLSIYPSDPVHAMIQSQAAALLLPKMIASVVFPSKEAELESLEAELASVRGPKSPSDLKMIRLGPFVFVWVQQILEMQSHADKKLLDRLCRAAKILAAQFESPEYLSQQQHIFDLVKSLSDARQLLEQAEVAQANKIAQELIEAAQAEELAKQQRWRKKQEKQKCDKSEELEILPEPLAIPAESPCPKVVSSAQAYSREEIFLMSLEQDRQSPSEKIITLDRYCEEHSKSLSENIGAQVFFELARSSWLLSSSAADVELENQLLRLNKLVVQGEYREWLLPEIIKLQESLPVKKVKTGDQPLLISLPKNLSVILSALSESDQIGKFPGKAYVVGGLVRDKILELENFDFDIVVLGYPEEVYKSEIFQRKLISELAKKFEILEENIRIETSFLDKLLLLFISKERFEIWFSPEKKLENDAKSRDFSFNAMYADQFGLVYSPIASSLQDCRNRCCRPINAKIFFDDPLRLLRLLDYQVIREYRVDESLLISFEEKLKLIRSMNEEELTRFLGDAKQHFAAKLKKLLLSAINKNSMPKVLKILRSLGLEVLLLMMPEDCGRLYGYVPFTSAVSLMRKANVCVFDSKKQEISERPAVSPSPS